MSDALGDVLAIEELADCLKIPKSTLYKLVSECKIPSQKVGRHWRFRKPAIDRWLENAPGNIDTVERADSGSSIPRTN